MKTWQVETAFVVLVLLCTSFTTWSWLEVVAAFAVLFTFMHLQISMRHAEAAEAGVKADNVDCHKWGPRYLIAKELLWLVYFTGKHAWVALTSVFLFIAYPYWRHWWRSRHPLVEVVTNAKEETP